MASLNQVSIELQVKGQQEVQRAFKNLEKAQDGLNRGIKASIDVSNKNAKSLDRITREAAKAQREMDRLDKAVRKGTITQSQFAGESNRIASRLKSLGMAKAQSEVMKYSYALNQARDGSVMLSNATVKATATNDQFENQVRQTTAAVKAQAGAQKFYGRNVSRAGVLTQQAGYQVGDFIVQVQGGTNAFVAFGQQATQMAGILTLLGGKWILIGSVLGVAIPLLTAFGAALSRTGGGAQIFDDLAFAIEPIKPLIDAIAVAMTAVANTAIDFVNILVNNLDRIVLAATVVAGFFAAKWVASFIVAGNATLFLNKALNILRVTLLRLPFIALLAGAIELTYQFTRLVKGAGGFGNALSLLKDVAVELFDRMKMSASSIGASIAALFLDIKADAASSMESSIESVVGFGNKAVNTFQGTFFAIQEVFSAIPDVFKRIGILAINNLIDAMESGIASITESINNLLTLGGRKPEWAIEAPDMSGFKKTVPQAVDIGGRAAEGFARGFEEDLLKVPDIGLSKIAKEALESANTYREASEDLAKGARLPIKSWEALKEALANANEEGRNIDVRDWFGGMGGEESEDGSGGSGKGATDRTKDALTELQEKVQSVADTIKNSMSEAFMSMVEGTKSAKDAFRDMARAILKQLFEVIVVQQIVGSFDAKKGTGSGIVGSIMGLFANANGNAFNNGNVIPFANGGVVSSPTMFPMAGSQTGLMGEAGPEAIMPLKRGKGGKLGVVAEGGQQPVVINQSFNFSANGDESVKRIIAQEAPRIANLTQKQIIDQRRRGGTMKAAFG